MTEWLGDHRGVRWYPGVACGDTEICVHLSEDREVVLDAGGAPLITPLDRLESSQTPILVGTLGHEVIYGVRARAESGLITEPLRPAIIHADTATFIKISGASQVLDFYEEHQFCGRCGEKTIASGSDRGRVCPACALRMYPRIAPCVIVLITRGDEVLLARAPRFVGGMYSTLAGFIEAGESAEHAAHREIFEEVGVRIHPPLYQGSQSWPFRHSLMLGYRAEHAEGDIKIDGEEIVDAQWFHLSQLPKLPPNASISRGMIEAYRSERGF